VITNYTIEPCVLMEGGQGAGVILGAKRKREEGGRDMDLEKVKNVRWV
jgi:hypothetical protein